MVYFYLFQNEKKIIISDLDKEKAKLKYGHKFELLNSVNDQNAVAVIKSRLEKQYPTFKVLHKQRKKFTMSSETKKKMSKAKKGKKMPEEVKIKISLARKGKSNFEGKRHTEESRKKQSLARKFKPTVKGWIWIYNPKLNKEKRVASVKDIPEGFIIGRNYDSVEHSISILKDHTIQRSRQKQKLEI